MYTLKNKNTVDWGKSKVYDFLPFCVAFRTEKRLSILGYPVEPFTARKAKHTTISLKQKFIYLFKIQILIPGWVPLPQVRASDRSGFALPAHEGRAQGEHRLHTRGRVRKFKFRNVIFGWMCEGIYVVFPVIPCLFATPSTSIAWTDPTTHSRIAGATTERGTTCTN